MKWKKATAVLLSMVMAVTAAACGSTRQTQGGSSETGIADSQGTESAREESGQVPTLTMFVDETWWPYENGRAQYRKNSKNGWALTLR